MEIIGKTNIWLKYCLRYSKISHSAHRHKKSFRTAIQIKFGSKYPVGIYSQDKLIRYRCKCSFWCLFSKLKQMLQVHPSLHSKSQNIFCVGKQIRNTTYVNNSKLKKSTPHQCHSSTMLYKKQADFGFSFQTHRRNTNIWTSHILLRTNSN